MANLVTINRAGVTNAHYYLSVVANVSDTLYETAATNNTATSISNIYVQVTPLPALAVTQITAPTNGLGGQTISVSWTVCNQGAADTTTPVWYDHLYLSSTPNLNGVIADYGTFENPSYLASGQCYQQQATVAIPLGVGGQNYFIVTADSTGMVAASDATSYTADPHPIAIQEVLGGFFHTVSVQVAPAPPTQTWPGSTITCTYVVQNTGQTAITGAWDDRLTLSAVSNFINGQTTVFAYENDIGVSGPLAPGEMYTNSAQFTLPPTVGGSNVAGVWYVVPVVNIHLGAGSGNVGRDELAAALDVIPPPPAQLVTSNVLAPVSAAEGQSITVSWTVSNEGFNQTSSDSWPDVIYLSTNPVFNASQSTQIGALQHFGTLPVSGSYTASATETIPSNLLPAGLSSAAYYLFVEADATSNVFVLNRSNNVAAAAKPIVISPLLPADLAVSSVTVPGLVVAGNAGTISWSVVNKGIATTSVSNWTDAVYLSPTSVLNPGTATLLGVVPQTGALAPGATIQRCRRSTSPTA